MSIIFDNTFSNNATINLFETTLKPLFGRKFFHKNVHIKFLAFMHKMGFSNFNLSWTKSDQLSVLSIVQVLKFESFDIYAKD